MSPEDFGELLRLTRIDRMMSVREAAEDAGISSSTFNRTEHGGTPSLRAYQVLSEWITKD